MDVCPTKAISYKAGKIILHGPQLDAQPDKKQSLHKVRCFAWVAALTVLAGALLLNKPESKPLPIEPVATEIMTEQMPAVTEDVSIPTGYEVGMRSADFTAELYGDTSATFCLSEHRGKTVIVNFWATWCTPCCNELPHFDELSRNHPEDVVVIALHSNMVTDDVEKYLNQFDYQMPFGLDETGEIIAAFNGSTMLPQTVVIDADGIITYNAVGSVTYEMLEKLVAEAGIS
jgi:thiol-disulfide isomerase/thioredoxin